MVYVHSTGDEMLDTDCVAKNLQKHQGNIYQTEHFEHCVVLLLFLFSLESNVSYGPRHASGVFIKFWRGGMKLKKQPKSSSLLARRKINVDLLG